MRSSFACLFSPIKDPSGEKPPLPRNDSPYEAFSKGAGGPRFHPDDGDERSNEAAAMGSGRNAAAEEGGRGTTSQELVTS